MTSLPGCMHEVTDCGLSFFKWRKIVLRPTPIMRAVARHPTPFMAISMIFLVRTGLRSGVSELQLPCFYGSESRDSADVRRCFCRYAPPRQ
nr:hypothetical protein [Escherichia coli]